MKKVILPFIIYTKKYHNLKLSFNSNNHFKKFEANYANHRHIHI